jgi:hypothetical protein
MNVRCFICGVQKYITFSTLPNLFSTFFIFFENILAQLLLLLNLYQTTGDKSNTFFITTKKNYHFSCKKNKIIVKPHKQTPLTTFFLS